MSRRLQCMTTVLFLAVLCVMVSRNMIPVPLARMPRAVCEGWRPGELVELKVSEKYS